MFIMPCAQGTTRTVRLGCFRAAAIAAIVACAFIIIIPGASALRVGSIHALTPTVAADGGAESHQSAQIVAGIAAAFAEANAAGGVRGAPLQLDVVDVGLPALAAAAPALATLRAGGVDVFAATAKFASAPVARDAAATLVAPRTFDAEPLDARSNVLHLAGPRSAEHAAVLRYTTTGPHPQGEFLLQRWGIIAPESDFPPQNATLNDAGLTPRQRDIIRIRAWARENAVRLLHEIPLNASVTGSSAAARPDLRWIIDTIFVPRDHAMAIYVMTHEDPLLTRDIVRVITQDERFEPADTFIVTPVDALLPNMTSYAGMASVLYTSFTPAGDDTRFRLVRDAHAALRSFATAPAAAVAAALNITGGSTVPAQIAALGSTAGNATSVFAITGYVTGRWLVEALTQAAGTSALALRRFATEASTGIRVADLTYGPFAAGCADRDAASLTVPCDCNRGARSVFTIGTQRQQLAAAFTLQHIAAQGACSLEAGAATLALQIIASSTAVNNSNALNTKFSECFAGVQAALTRIKANAHRSSVAPRFGAQTYVFDGILEHASAIDLSIPRPPAAKFLLTVMHRYNALLSTCNAATRDVVSRGMTFVPYVGTLHDSMEIADAALAPTTGPPPLWEPLHVPLLPTYVDFMHTAVRFAARLDTDTMHFIVDDRALLPAVTGVCDTSEIDCSVRMYQPLFEPTFPAGAKAITVVVARQSASLRRFVDFVNTLTSPPSATYILAAPEYDVHRALRSFSGSAAVLDRVVYATAFEAWPLQLNGTVSSPLESYADAVAELTVRLSDKAAAPTPEALTALLYSGAIEYVRGLAVGPLNGASCGTTETVAHNDTRRQQYGELVGPWTRPATRCQCSKGTTTFHLRSAREWHALITSPTPAAIRQNPPNFTLVLPACGVRFKPLPEKQNIALIIGMVVMAGVVLAIVAAAVAFGIPRYRLYARLKHAPRDAAKPFTIVFTDIESSTPLWAFAPHDMGRALDIHNEVIRTALRSVGGYEVKTVGDSFMCAFDNAADAVVFACEVQRGLHAATFPPVFDEYYADFTLRRGLQLLPEGEYKRVWNGMRVRIGVHAGEGQITFDETQQIYDYYGSVVNTAARVEHIGHGGQIIVTDDVMEVLRRNSCLDGGSAVSSTDGTRMDASASYEVGATQVILRNTELAVRGAANVVDLGSVELRGVPQPVHVWQLVPEEFCAREFPALRCEGFAVGDYTEAANDDVVELLFATADDLSSRRSLAASSRRGARRKSAAATVEQSQVPAILLATSDPSSAARLRTMLIDRVCAPMQLSKTGELHVAQLIIRVFHALHATLEVLPENTRSNFLRDSAGAWRLNSAKSPGDTEHDLKMALRVAIKSCEVLVQKQCLEFDDELLARSVTSDDARIGLGSFAYARSVVAPMASVPSSTSGGTSPRGAGFHFGVPESTSFEV